MIAVITGDVIGSVKSTDVQSWMRPLTTTLAAYGKEPKNWQVYRGDSFQAMVPAHRGLTLTLHLRAALRASGFGLRMSLGLGEVSHRDPQVTRANGTAFVHSGQAFESMAGTKRTLVIRSGDKEFNRNWDVYFFLLEALCDGWTTGAAEIVALQFDNPQAVQSDLAAKLRITQPSVSARLKVAHFEHIQKVLELYEETLKSLT